MASNIGVNTVGFNSKVWNLVQAVAPQLVAEIAASKRRFMHEEIIEALGAEAAGTLANIIRNEGLWDEESNGLTMEIPLNDTGRAFSVSDDDEEDYPTTGGLCIMVNPS